MCNASAQQSKAPGMHQLWPSRCRATNDASPTADHASTEGHQSRSYMSHFLCGRWQWNVQLGPGTIRVWNLLTPQQPPIITPSRQLLQGCICSILASSPDRSPKAGPGSPTYVTQNDPCEALIILSRICLVARFSDSLMIRGQPFFKSVTGAGFPGHPALGSFNDPCAHNPRGNLFPCSL